MTMNTMVTINLNNASADVIFFTTTPDTRRLSTLAPLPEGLLHADHWRQVPALQSHLRCLDREPGQGVLPDHQRHLQRQVAVRVLLPEGLHVRLPDRDQGLQ